MRKLFKERKLFKGGNYMRKYGTYKLLCICLEMKRYLHAMFSSKKMLHNYIVWSSHANLTDGASIITNFNH